MFEPKLDIKRDTYANQDAPAQNYGDKAALVLNGQTSHKRYVYLFFAPPTNFAGDLVIEALLTLYTKDIWSAGPTTVTAKRITQSWKEDQLKWNNVPSVSATHSATDVIADNAPAGTQIELDITDMMQDVASGDVWYGVRLEIDVTGSFRVYSSEESVHFLRPSVSLAYTSAPDAATDLSPNSGINVYTDTPLLRWEFMSSVPGESQAASWVQVTTTDDPDFLTPEFDDTDFVVNTLNQYDLADTAYAGVTDEEERLWRVKVRDTNGGESDWSDVATFAYFSPGTLTIVAPAADDDDVEDSTPSIDWTFTGRTQSLAKLTLFHWDGTQYVLVYPPTYLKTTDTDWTVPEGYILVPGDTYKARVDVVDTLFRQGPISAERVFQFEPTASVTAPGSLTAAVNGPGIELTWTRASQPDSWGIYVDGKLVDVQDGADLFQSGTTYGYILYANTAGGEHDITVRAKTDGTGWSLASNTVSITHRPIGIWLVETSQDIAIRLTDKERVQQSLSVDGETFYLLNRRDPVRVSGVARGYSGSAAGSLVGDADLTATEQREALESILGLYATSPNLRLVFGKQSFPVIVADFTYSQWPDAEAYDVSFSWWQTGEYTTEVPS